MQKFMFPLVISGVVLIAGGSLARAGGTETLLLGDGGWEAFSGLRPAGSFAWAGEDETFSESPAVLGAPQRTVELDERAIDVELITGLPAPEPPAWVLAGMAFGGVLCGRSLMRRRAQTGLHQDAGESRD